MGRPTRSGRLERLQRRPELAVAVTTVQHFTKTKSANLAAMMAFWAFFSLFPLLMAAATILRFTVPEEDSARVMERLSSYFPLVDAGAVSGGSGTWLAVALGLGLALWSGSAVVRVSQDAFNSVWEVPASEGPGLGVKLARSGLALVTVGVGLLASTLLIGFLAGDDPPVDLGPLTRLLGFGLAIGVDIGLFIVAFRLLTQRHLTTGDVLPGAVLAGIGFWVLQSVSALLITRHLSSAQDTYGSFATVITILWWFHLQAQLTLLGANLNVVVAQKAVATKEDERRARGGARDDAHSRPDEDRAGSLAPPGRDRRSPTAPRGSAREAEGSNVMTDTHLYDNGAQYRPGRPEEMSTRELIVSVTEQTSGLIRDEIALAVAEVKEQGKGAARGAGLAGAAGVLGLYAGGALVATCIAALALTMEVWAAALITTAVLLALGVVLGLTGKKQVARAVPPGPRRAVAGVQADINTVKESVQQ